MTFKVRLLHAILYGALYLTYHFHDDWLRYMCNVCLLTYVLHIKSNITEINFHLADISL